MAYTKQITRQSTGSKVIHKKVVTKKYITDHRQPKDQEAFY